MLCSCISSGLRKLKSRRDVHMFDVKKIREDFPILSREVNGKRLVYLDNASTTQKPVQVIGCVSDFYSRYNANVHRGVHTLSVEATEAYEATRKKVCSFINARSASEIVFTRSATEAINVAAFSWGRANLREGDGILLTEMEHHSNLVPWQALAAEKKLELKFIPVLKGGMLDLSGLDDLLAGVKLVCLTQASNVLGTINDVGVVARKAHSAGALVLVDGAQSVPHSLVDVRSLDCDFLAFSGHKMLGPTGVGVFYGRRELLEGMPPFNFGSDMIREVSFERTSFNDLPWKFEAGTPDVAGVVGFGAALDYLSGVGMRVVREHEAGLTEYALQRLSGVGGVALYGPRAVDRVGVVSFNLAGVHAHDVATVLDAEGLAVRSGHHCAMPLMGLLGVPATVRASFYLYNSFGEVDALVAGVEKTKSVFGVK